MRCKALKPTSDSRLQDFLGTLQSFETYTPKIPGQGYLARAIFEQARGHYQPEQLAFVLKNLGEIYLRQHRVDDAESLLRRALAIREKEFGPVHERVAYTLHSLAGDLSPENSSKNG